MTGTSNQRAYFQHSVVMLYYNLFMTLAPGLVVMGVETVNAVQNCTIFVRKRHQNHLEKDLRWLMDKAHA